MAEGLIFFSIDYTIEVELHAQFFNMFSETLHQSQTTGYDWEHVSEATQGEQVVITVQSTAPPGMDY